MSKVCILSTVDFSRMTMLSIFTDYLESKNIEYDVICVNKFGDKITSSASNVYEFDASTAMEYNLLKKLKYFWKMRDFAEEIFNNNKYDFVIVWNQVTAFIFSDILKKKFKGRYCINIRDYHFDSIPIVRWRVGTAVKNAAFNTVSSEMFKKYLPKGDYLTVHSLNRSMLSKLKPKEKYKDKEEPINILNIGQIRWYENIYPMIDELANDPRYILTFVGQGAEKIDEYVKGKNINNIVTHGRFNPEDTIKFLEDADVIFNLYGVGNKHVDTALSIKLYYAIYLNIPILTYEGTYINKVAREVDIAYSINKEKGLKNLGDQFFEWYHNVDVKKIKRSCIDFMNVIDKSHSDLYKKLSKSLDVE